MTWDNVESAGWSVGELASGLTCSCLPTFRPLLHRWLPDLTRTGRSTGSYKHGKSGSRSAASNGIRNYPKHVLSVPSTLSRSDRTAISHEIATSDFARRREKYYELSESERKDSDEEFILRDLQNPQSTRTSDRHECISTRRHTDVSDQEQPPSSPTTMVRTEISSAPVSTLGRYVPQEARQESRMRRDFEGAIVIERDIVQTEHQKPQ